MTKKEWLTQFNKISSNTLMETLNMSFTDVDAEKGFLEVSMEVGPHVHQPMGLLHGGASAAMVETVGSSASLLFVDYKQYAVLGIEISCNHLKSVRTGLIRAQANILHKGRSTHLWEVRILDNDNNLVCHAKLTNMIVPLKK